MVKLVSKAATLACFAAVALVGACGGDDDNGNGGFDAPSGGGADAGMDAVGAQSFTFALTPGAEVPLCAAGSAGAGGTATVMVNAAGTEVSVNATFSQLSGAATAAHIHVAAAGQQGLPALTFATPIQTPLNATFDSGDYTATGSLPATFADLVTAIRTGGTYLNIHTQACSGGEIRGQIR
jgi:hypothetical protein